MYVLSLIVRDVTAEKYNIHRKYCWLVIIVIYYSTSENKKPHCNLQNDKTSRQCCLHFSRIWQSILCNVLSYFFVLDLKASGSENYSFY